MSMTDDHLQPLVAAECLALARVLEGLGPAEWDTPSLCEGWRVREVVAHLTMPARYGEEAFMAELRDCEFDFTRLSNRVATRDAELPTGELVSQLRSDVMQRWTPPGGGYAGALNHVVVHGLDVTVPLGRPRVATDETVRTVLDGLAGGGGHAHFGIGIEGQQLVATDIRWTYGEGPARRGTAQDLVLHLTGRSRPGRGTIPTGPAGSHPPAAS